MTPDLVAHYENQVKRWKDTASARAAEVSQLEMQITHLRQNGAMHGRPIKLTVADLPTVVASMVAAAPIGYGQTEWIVTIIDELNKHRRHV